MDPLGAHWFSKLEEADDDSDDFINQWQIMKSINNNNCFDNIPPPHDSAAGSYSSAYPSSSCESIQEISPPQKLETHYNKIISFGDSYSPKSNDLCGRMQNYTTTTSTVKTESKTTTTTSAANAMRIGEMMNFSSAEVVLSPSFNFGGCETQPIHKKGCNRTPLQAQDHVLAERKRRERLSERFVALSAMIPGLKKLDKASVLGGAIKYLKQMEERIKLLEEEKENRKQEELPSSKRTRTIASSSSDDQTTSGSSSSDDDNNSSSEIFNIDPPREIEVRISDTNVLVRVYCEKRNGIIKEILGEIEKLSLGIISSSVIPFGTTTISITVIAQMDGEDCIRAQEIANSIKMAIQKII